MNITVGTDAVQLDVPHDSRPLIQNLGTGKVYMGGDDTVTTTDGIELNAGDIYEFFLPLNEGSLGSVWLIGDTADTDVRALPL